MNFLSQNWVATLISLSGIIIGGIISFIFYKKSIRKAIPVFQYRSDSIIGLNNSSHKEDISIYYKEKRVNRLSKLYVVFWNAGNQTLRGEDIAGDGKLKLNFEGEGEIVKSNIVKMTRNVNDISYIYNSESKVVDFKFDFLDKDDGVIFEFIHTFRNKKPSINGIIKGIPEGVKNDGYNRDIFSEYEESFSSINRIYRIANSKIILTIYLLIGSFFLYSFFNYSKLPSWFFDTSDFANKIMCLVMALFFIVPITTLKLLDRKRRIPNKLLNDID